MTTEIKSCHRAQNVGEIFLRAEGDGLTVSVYDEEGAMIFGASGQSSALQIADADGTWRRISPLLLARFAGAFGDRTADERSWTRNTPEQRSDFVTLVQDPPAETPRVPEWA